MGESNNTFYLAILFGLKIEWSVEKSGGMLGTDGISLFINPDYFMTRSYEGVKADLYHEVLHCAMGHIGYAKKHNLDPTQHNIACDFWINLQLKDSGTEIDSTFLFEDKYRNWSIKQIYDDLPAEPPEDYVPDIKDNGDLPKEEQDAKEMEIKNLVSRAVVQAQMSNDYSSIPSELQRLVEELLDPKLPWNVILAEYMTAYDKTDYSFRRPNRRCVDEDIRTPSLYGESMGDISIYIDTSGSIDDKTFTSILSEVQGISDKLNPTRINVWQWGSTMPKPTVVDKDGDLIEEVELKMLGGTEIELPLRNIKKTQPEISLIFSDMYFDVPQCIPTTDIIWIAMGNPTSTVDFGELIHME